MNVCSQTMHLAQLTSRRIAPGQFMLVPSPIMDNGVYLRSPQFTTSNTEHDIAMMAGTEDTQPIEVWHLRLGHLNQSAIRQLTSKATGLIIGPPKAQTLSMNCESCLRGSQHRNISRSRSCSASSKLEHVWADIKGPLLDKDILGYRYFVVFVDEFSRYTVELPLTHRGHLCNAYKLFEARAERLSGALVVNLHADGEFIGEDLRTHLRNKGIALLLTQPYAPQMNGIAERTIRTIIEHASSMLWAAKLPIGFWASAVKCAVFLMNRSPHSALEKQITPYEAWFGKKPNLGFLKVFGCRAAAHVPDELRLKAAWTSKSSPNCVFIGYSETENLFELWDVDKSNVIRKRDVIFWEHELGHPRLTSALPHGVSILPAIASELMNANAEHTPLRNTAQSIRTPEDHPPPPTEPPVIARPLTPRAGRQSIESLPSEPTTVERAKDGQYQFIEEPLPSQMQQKVSEIKSNLPSSFTFIPDPLTHNVAKFLHDVNLHDDLFMNEYMNSNWMEPENSAMNVALGESMPLDAYNTTFMAPDSTTRPLLIPHIDKDVPQNYK